MNFKNKIILTSFILLAFILFFNINNVLAYSNISNTGVEYTFPDELLSIIKSSEYYNDDYYVMGFKSTYHGNYYINFVKKTDSLKITFNNQNDFSANENVNYYSWAYKISDFSLVVKSDLLTNKSYNAQSLFGKKCDSNIFYLDKGKFYTSSGEVFFQVPVTAVVIPSLETAEQIPQAIAKTLKILIPIGLIVLSVGLGIYLIKRVIYLTK